MDPNDMIEAILAWAENKPWFDTEMVLSFQEQASTRMLSARQIEVLENIIEKWKIQS